MLQTSMSIQPPSLWLTNLGLWFVTRIFLLELGSWFRLWGSFDGRYIFNLLAFLSYLARNLTHFSKLLWGKHAKTGLWQGQAKGGGTAQHMCTKHTYIHNTHTHTRYIHTYTYIHTLTLLHRIHLQGITWTIDQCAHKCLVKQQAIKNTWNTSGLHIF